MESITNKQKQKNREKYCIKEFLSIKYPDAELIYRKDEEHKDLVPDSIIQLEGRNIGIEHINIKHSDLANSEGPRRNIVLGAQRLAEANKISPVIVQVLFREKNLPESKKDRKTLSTKLYETIRNNINKISKEKSTCLNIPENRQENMQENIQSIYARHAFYGRKCHYWSSVEAGWILTLRPEKIQELIDKKNPKHKEYINSNCNDVWLLIIIDRTKNDQRFVLDKNISNTIFNSEFSKIFIFDIINKEVTLLKTQAR